MSVIHKFRVFLLASASVAALWAGQLDAQASDLPPAPLEPLAPVENKGVISITAMGYGFWQTDRGYDFGAPFGTIDPLKGLGGGLGVAYQPALSPWSFGVNARYGVTSKKNKSVTTTTVTPTPLSIQGSRKASHFIVDFTIGRDMGLGTTPVGDPYLQLQAGLRFAHLQDKTSLHLLTPFGGSSGANAKREFAGFGPRIGLAVSMPLAASFSLDGTAGAALLYGRSSEKIDLTSSGILTSSLKKTKNVWVPSLDASLAVSYAFNASAKISLGYRVEGYFNAYPAIVPGGPPRDKDMVAHGPFVQAKFSF
jgi:hypothetical protein